MRRMFSVHFGIAMLALAALSTLADAQGQNPPQKNPLRNVYFGDLHLHTMLSFDAFTIGTRTTPDDAYRYAKGEPIEYGGRKIQRKTPLDFLSVTDHAEYMGVIRMLADANSPLSQSSWAAGITSTDPPTRSKTFLALAQTISGNQPISEFVDEQVLRSNWRIIIDAAERAYQPGKFTTFIGYEWTSFPDNQNLHRNVIFRGSKVPPKPFSVFDSQKPEDLWTVLENGRKDGIDALAIPHNANVSNGLMYNLVDSDGQPQDPESAALQRLQVVKGWMANGESHEQVFDVACADTLTPDPQTHRCPDNAATVNLTDCSIPKEKGAVELSTVWTDPTFKAEQRAFYYARVIENPACRWSTWDALRNKLDLPKHIPATIQERAWASPIWYAPSSTP